MTIFTVWTRNHTEDHTDREHEVPSVMWDYRDSQRLAQRLAGWLDAARREAAQ